MRFLHDSFVPVFRMPDPKDSEILFLEHLGWIDRVSAMTCGRYGIWGADAEDFASFIRLKLVEDDYAIIRKFRGEAGLKTYLATVVVRQFHDYLRERRGRWRISAAAERLGPPAGELEALVYRDGFRLDQAGETLRTRGRTTLSDPELARLLQQLPQREALRPREVSEEAAADTADAAQHADDRVELAESGKLHEKVMSALHRALEHLEPEEQMIVRMHFGDGRTLADVARTLKLEQKPLYRRVERLRQKLRGYLEQDGVQGGDVRGVVGEREVP